MKRRPSMNKFSAKKRADRLVKIAEKVGRKHIWTIEHTSIFLDNLITDGEVALKMYSYDYR
jgi:ribosomal protein L31E